MSSIDRPLGGEVLVFDLAEEGERTVAPAGGRGGRTLLKEGALRLTLVRVGAGGSLREHSADGPISIHVLEGDLEFEMEGRTESLKAGQVLTAPAAVSHAVRSANGALFLLTVAKRES